jgi:transcriptional regulator of acetoin/glycerol metabolism
MDDRKHKDGGRKHIPTKEYRDAADETGSVRGVARALGVSYSTAYSVLKTHEITVESLGGPPQGES